MSGARNKLIAALVALVTLAVPTAAQGEMEVESFDVRVENATGGLETRAAAHPDAIDVSFRLTRSAIENPSGSPKDIRVSLPTGFIGNPQALPTCTRPEFLNAINPDVQKGCRPESQVGVIRVMELIAGAENPQWYAVYNLEPGANQIADFAFILSGVPVHLVPEVRSDGDYGINVNSPDTSQGAALLGTDVTFWGYPMDDKHTPLRVCNPSFDVPGGPKQCASPAPRRAFLTNPSVCGNPLTTVMSLDSWLEPGNFKTATSTTPTGLTGCEGLVFEPTLTATSNTRSAEAPLGMTVDLEVPQAENPDAFGTPSLKKAVVTFPKGVAISPPSADGLEGCSDAALALGSLAAPTCPPASKIGSLSLVTPVLAEPLSGDVILRSPRPGELFRLALVIRGPGFLIKLPGSATPDPETGQLTVTFDDSPQLPFSSLHLELNSGPRSPLSTPRACGTYTTNAELTSWARPSKAVSSPSSFTIDEGCGRDSQFKPGFEAGTTNPTAGASSPFVLRVSREDGEQNVSRIDAVLPEGVLAKLAGVALCGDAQAAAGDCPAASQVGTTTVGAGAGSNPLYVPQPGKAPTAVYLAGPYKGAPYSLVVKVPAQAGPFDLGTVSVRSAIEVDPVTAQVSVKSDPLPQILQGIPIAYRDIRVEVDRNDFTLNPTNCSPKSVDGTIVSSQGKSVDVSSRFQVGNCAALDFTPKLSLNLKGGTRRGSYPALRAVLKAKQGQANVNRVSVALPHSAFLAQEHIKTVCTRVQFAADACPAGSVYGHATATTPLLDKPLSGPVYLRSSSNPLPDLVVALRGQIDIDLAGRIDSVDGGIRTSFETVPDAPVTKFVLSMKGGKKGLLVNSRNLCNSTNKAKVLIDGQNGKAADQSPVLKNSCGKKAKKKQKKSAKRSSAGSRQSG